MKLPDNLQGGTGWFTHFDIAAFGLVAVLTCVIATGIKESMRVNLTLVAVKLFIVLFIIVMGIQYINTSNYTPFVPPAQHLESTSDTLKRPLWELMTGMEPQAFGVMGVISGAALVFFAYIGFDVVATTAEETRNPKRDLPIGIIGSLAICTILYVSVCLVITGMVSYDKIDPKGALAAAFRDHGHPGYAQIIAAGAVAGLATVVMTLMIGATRVMYAMSRDGLLPGWFAKIHPKYGTPHRPTAVLGVFTALVAGFLPIGEVAKLVNIGVLSAFIIICASVWVLRVRKPDLARSFRTPLVPLIPIIGIGFSIWLLAELAAVTWLIFLIWVSLGLLVYFAYGIRHSKLAQEQ